MFTNIIISLKLIFLSLFANQNGSRKRRRDYITHSHPMPQFQKVKYQPLIAPY